MGSTQLPWVKPSRPNRLVRAAINKWGASHPWLRRGVFGASVFGGGGGGSGSSETNYAHRAVFYSEKNGVAADGTDQSTAMQALLQTVYDAGGGTIVLPPGTTRCDSQLSIPNSGASAPLGKPIRITGAGAFATGRGGWSLAPSGGSILDLRASGSTGCIQSLGYGNLEIDHVTLHNGGSHTSPFVYSTYTTLWIHHAGFSGLIAAPATSNAQDAIVQGGLSLADPLDFNTRSVDAPFQGYGTVVDTCWFNGIRHAWWLRSCADHCVFQNCLVWQSCGGTSAIQFTGVNITGSPFVVGCKVLNSYIETINYTHGINCTYAQANQFVGNSFVDVASSHPTTFHYMDTGAQNNYIEPASIDTTAGATLMTEVAGVAGLNTAVCWTNSAITSAYPALHKIQWVGNSPGDYSFANTNGIGPTIRDTTNAVSWYWQNFGTTGDFQLQYVSPAAATFYPMKISRQGTNDWNWECYEGSVRLSIVPTGNLELKSSGSGKSIIVGGSADKVGLYGNGGAVFRANAQQAAVVTTPATNTVPYGFATQAQADAIVTLVNELRAALVALNAIKGSA